MTNPDNIFNTANLGVEDTYDNILSFENLGVEDTTDLTSILESESLTDFSHLGVASTSPPSFESSTYSHTSTSENELTRKGSSLRKERKGSSSGKGKLKTLGDKAGYQHADSSASLEIKQDTPLTEIEKPILSHQSPVEKTAGRKNSGRTVLKKVVSKSCLEKHSGSLISPEISINTPKESHNNNVNLIEPSKTKDFDETLAHTMADTKDEVMLKEHLKSSPGDESSVVIVESRDESVSKDHSKPAK